MSKSNEIVIALCVDNNYFHQAVAVVNSIRFSSSTSVHVYFIGIALSDKNKQVIKTVGDDLVRITFLEVDANKYQGYKVSGHITFAAYVRLDLPSLLPNENKVLYLDADLIVKKDLSELWNTDLCGYALAAVENPFFDRQNSLKMKGNSSYFNSGVMLLDLNYFRKHQIGGRAYCFLENHKKEVVFHDQDALNHAVDGDWIALKREYNLQTFYLRKFHRFTKKEKREILTALKAPTIIHYSSGIKPWLSYDPHPFRSDYLKFFNGPISRPTGLISNTWAIVRYAFTKIYYFWNLKLNRQK